MPTKAYPRMNKIAVIDSGFRYFIRKDLKHPNICKTGHYNFTKQKADIGDVVSDHGTHVAYTIAENLKTEDYCILVYNIMYFDEDNGISTMEHLIEKAVIKALQNKATHINLSLAGWGIIPSEMKVFRLLHALGIPVFVAAGNSNYDLNCGCVVYPGCYRSWFKNIFVVGNKQSNTYLSETTNYGKIVNVCEVGRNQFDQGTSIASPIALAKYINGELETNNCPKIKQFEPTTKYLYVPERYNNECNIKSKEKLYQ